MTANWLNFHRLRVAHLRKIKIFEDLVITHDSYMVKSIAIACSEAWSLLSSYIVKSPTQDDVRLRKSTEKNRNGLHFTNWYLSSPELEIWFITHIHDSYLWLITWNQSFIMSHNLWLTHRYNSTKWVKMLTFKPVVGDQSWLHHSRALGMLIQKSDHSSDKWSMSGQ